MSAVNRFTTLFDPAEDRIKLLLELKTGEVQVLWLTRRLLNRLLPPLLGGLEAAPAVQTVPKPQAQAVQRFNQAAAVGGMQRQKAVTPTREAPQKQIAMLVTSVDIRAGQSNRILDLKGGKDILQSLPFSEEALRQWLDVVHSQYRNAGWSEPFWPSWMEPLMQDESPDLRLN